MRSSIFQRGGLPLGVVLAGLLGLSGVTLLVVAGPVSMSLPGRAYVSRGHEARRVLRDAPQEAPEPPHRLPFARERVVRTWLRSETPPSPVEVDTPVEPEPAPAPEPEPVRPRRILALALDRLACLGDREPGWTERDGCHERLGALANASPALPAIDPDKRADYDAVARAQAPRRALVPLTARGAGGAFAGDDRSRAGKSPRVGCALKFGLGADETPKAGGLDAGPCYIRAEAR